MPENGLSVAFFCGGSMTGVTAITPSHVNPDRQNRIIRRLGRWGPIEDWLLVAQPEQRLFTDHFPDGGDLMGARLVEPCLGVADWVCTNTQGVLASQLYNGTGLADGDRIRNLIGHEFTGLPNREKPGLEVLAESHLFAEHGGQTPNTYTATLYPGGKGNFVFNSSTMWWPQWLNVSSPVPFPEGGGPRFTWVTGLIDPDPGDMQKVEQMTINLFNMFLGQGGTRSIKRGASRRKPRPKPGRKPQKARTGKPRRVGNPRRKRKAARR
jgi:hypothetical protein